MKARGVSVEFDIVSNPEFLKEGAAIADFMKPDRVVVGTDSVRAAELMRALYEPFTRNRDRMIVMDVRSAELTKYAANAMLATKISFMNELANLAEQFGADIETVRVGIGSDPAHRLLLHLSRAWATAAPASPRTCRRLKRSAEEVGYKASILTAVEAVNERQKRVLFDKIKAHLRRPLAARPSRCGAWPSSPIPTTCARRRAACSWRRSGRRAPRCAPTIRWPCPNARRIYGDRA